MEIMATFKGQRKMLATGIMLCLGQWDAASMRVKGRPDAAALNGKLSRMLSFVNKTLDDMVRDGIVSLSLLSPEPQCERMTFPEYIERRIPLRIAGETSRQRYRTFLDTFRRWGGIKDFADITAASIRRFDEWLHTRVVSGKHYKQSTIYGYHKYLKAFISDAVVDGHLHSNPYKEKRIRIERGNSRQIECLSAAKLSAIETTLLTGYLEKTRDLFLFQCYTGLAYADLMLFDMSKCEKVGDSLVMRGERQKTGIPYTVVLLPKAINILKKHNGQLPHISNQKYNEYLKALGSIIGVPHLHSHMGRSTFASMMLNSGIGTDILKRCLGHTTTIQTDRYATMEEQTIIDAFNGLG